MKITEVMNTLRQWYLKSLQFRKSGKYISIENDSKAVNDLRLIINCKLLRFSIEQL
jgi:hypothetical protein